MCSGDGRSLGIIDIREAKVPFCVAPAILLGIFKLMKPRFFTSIFFVVVLCTLASAQSTVYAKIKGQKQGQFKGGVTRKGQEGAISVLACSHEIVSPRDNASGMATGKRQHRPIVITMELDKATPLFYNAMSTNENLSEVTLDFWGPNKNGLGTETQFYTIKLTNASIVSIKFNKHNQLDPAQRGMPDTVEVSLGYQKIEWTWKDGGITGMDSWGG